MELKLNWKYSTRRETELKIGTRKRLGLGIELVAVW